MSSNNNIHSFHIPVMGLAYTIDSPIRVAQYGISSVISIIDDELIDNMNLFYSKKFNKKYEGIATKNLDYRAQRITSYLNLVQEIVNQKFAVFKQELIENNIVLNNYIAMLPNKSEIKKELQKIINDRINATENIKNYIEKKLSPGSIDVNIMTKIDKDNFIKNEQQSIIYNDAHASLRGFANSNLSSSVVLSAGMNPRLYSYFEEFKDFFPDANGQLKKKIILKVSDYRSAMIQGNFLAKKGLWVSEYRIESGLNCGGHAFATEGYLLGPILEEFKNKKEELIKTAHDLMIKALEQKGLHVPSKTMELKITAQGGVGTAVEHEFLLDYYQVDSVGWGSPFLLVPEATSVDSDTRKLLAHSKEENYYLSHISPLGIPFNTLKGTTNENIKSARINEKKSGSSCPKKFLALSKEFSNQGICTASRKYQNIKLEELDGLKNSISTAEYNKKKVKITEKSCLCVGLANAAYIENDIKIKGEEQGIVICPGPNLAYFDKEVSLSEMVQHIYGNSSVLGNSNRPNMFINELKMYVDYLKKEIEDIAFEISTPKIKRLQLFKNNLLEGIDYYTKIFSETDFFKSNLTKIKKQLQEYKKAILAIDIPMLEIV